MDYTDSRAHYSYELYVIGRVEEMSSPRRCLVLRYASDMAPTPLPNAAPDSVLLYTLLTR